MKALKFNKNFDDVSTFKKIRNFDYFSGFCSPEFDCLVRDLAIFRLKCKNYFDVIKSFSTFYDTPYYCHECKKAYTKRDKHKCPSKCLPCFTYTKDKKCERNEIICEKCNRKFLARGVLRITLKIDPR